MLGSVKYGSRERKTLWWCELFAAGLLGKAMWKCNCAFKERDQKAERRQFTCSCWCLFVCAPGVFLGCCNGADASFMERQNSGIKFA